MGRVRRKKKNANKATRINRMALVPLSEKRSSSLDERVMQHARMMQDMMDRGMDFKNIPPLTLAAIARDFQASGRPVPARALVAAAKFRPAQPSVAYRPAPIFADPTPTADWLSGRANSYAHAAQQTTRSTMMDLGIDPKTGYSVKSRAPTSILSYNPASNKRVLTGSSLPYTPVKRYATDVLMRGAASWRPPWMLYGDQPNQFVKSTSIRVRPASMGRGPAGPNAPVGLGLSLPPPAPPPRYQVSGRPSAGEAALYDSPVPGRPIPAAAASPGAPPRTPARSPKTDSAPATPKRSTPPKTPKRSSPPKPPKRSSTPKSPASASPTTPSSAAGSPPTPANNSPRLTPIRPLPTPKTPKTNKKTPQLDVVVVGASPKDQLLDQIRSRAGRSLKPAVRYSPSDDIGGGKGKQRPKKDDLFDMIKRRRLSVDPDDD